MIKYKKMHLYKYCLLYLYNRRLRRDQELLVLSKKAPQDTSSSFKLLFLNKFRVVRICMKHTQYFFLNIKKEISKEDDEVWMEVQK